MISYQEAVEIFTQAAPFAVLSLPVTAARDHVVSEAVTSQVFVPPFPNSAMDGFAVRVADVVNASETNNVILHVMGSTVAGDEISVSDAGGAWEIMTGAPVPDGYDAVVKIEDVTIRSTNAQGRPDEISLSAPVKLKNNIREAGEDFKPNDLLMESGARVRPQHVMALATIGTKALSVRPQPKVAVFTTGKEIVDDVDADLKPGQIRNSNSPYLLSALAELQTQPHYAGIIHDEPEVFEEKLQQELGGSDVIISTGAVSMGRHDFIPDSLRKLGAEIIFHKVAIRPGKPVLYARFPDGTHYFGLPGNPVSAAVGLRFFVVPLLRALQGEAVEQPLVAKSLATYSKKHKFRFFSKAHASLSVDGSLNVQILTGQESFKIHPMLIANCWAVVEEDRQSLSVGDLVNIYPLFPHQWDLEVRSVT